MRNFTTKPDHQNMIFKCLSLIHLRSNHAKSVIVWDSCPPRWGAHDTPSTHLIEYGYREYFYPLLKPYSRRRLEFLNLRCLQPQSTLIETDFAKIFHQTY